VKTKVKFGIGVGIILVTLSCLAFVGAQQSKTYYHTISEIPTLDGAALHQRLRVGGDVKNGSIQHYSGRMDFVLVEQGKSPPGELRGHRSAPRHVQGWRAMPGRRQSAARWTICS
jgi:cytochrome c-type biogenesis protein CcmE